MGSNFVSGLMHGFWVYASFYAWARISDVSCQTFGD